VLLYLILLVPASDWFDKTGFFCQLIGWEDHVQNDL